MSPSPCEMADGCVTWTTCTFPQLKSEKVRLPEQTLPWTAPQPLKPAAGKNAQNSSWSQSPRSFWSLDWDAAIFTFLYTYIHHIYGFCFQVLFQWALTIDRVDSRLEGVIIIIIIIVVIIILKIIHFICIALYIKKKSPSAEGKHKTSSKTWIIEQHNGYKKAMGKPL